MTKFTELHLENFFAHKDTTLQLDRRGLLLIRGRVIGRSMSNSNGAGKSSMLPDGLLYALFGKTLRGETDVVNLTVKRNCLVELRGTISDGRSFLIQRPKAHRTITKLQVTIGEDTYIGTYAQDIINTTILGGITFETAVAVLVYGYGNTKFFTSITDSERKKILDEIYSLDELTKFQKNANVLLQDATNKLSEINTFQCERRAEIASYDTVIQSIESAGERIKNLVFPQINEIKLQLEETDARIEHTTKLRDEGAVIYEDGIILNEKLEEKVAELQSKVNGSASKMLQFAAQVQQIEKEISTLKEKSRFFGKLKTCMYCQQGIDEHQHALVIEKLEADIVSKQEQIKSIQIKRAEEEMRVTPIYNELQKYLIELNNVRVEMSRLEKLANRSEDELHGLFAAQEAFTVSLKSLERELVVNTGLRNETIIKKKAAEKMLAKKKEEGDKLLRRINYLNYWIKAFGNKGIRSHILDGVMPRLNASAEFYSQILTNGELKVEFSSQTELKSGELSEKIDVKVSIMDASGTYRGCSGGERRRADIICTLALGDLAQSRLNQAFNIVVLDEILDGLDDTGIERSADLLNRLASERSSVFVISHSDKIDSTFPNVLTVQWKDGISSLP